MKEVIDLENPQFFERLYKIHFKKVFTICYSSTNNVEVAKGLTQEVFSSLWERRKQIKIEGGLERYLFKSAKYKSIDYLRKQKLRQATLANDTSIQNSLAHSTENVFEHQNLLDEIQQAVDLMPKKCKEVFVLSRKKGLSNREIADTMVIAEKTVKNHINRALHILRHHLSD